jgi:MoaA/NifB/PqqE/SkfB family radical SAM enzyme
MNTMKSVMARMAEANKALELASHKIELGAAEDLAKAKGELDAIMKQLANEKVKLKTSDDGIAKEAAAKIVKDSQVAADKAYAASEKYTASVSKTLTRIDGVLTKVEKQAKDLGVDVKSIPNYADVNKMYTSVEDENASVKNFSFVNE